MNAKHTSPPTRKPDATTTLPRPKSEPSLHSSDTDTYQNSPITSYYTSLATITDQSHTYRDHEEEDRFRILTTRSERLLYISPTPSELDIGSRRELNWILQHVKNQGHPPRRRRTELWDGLKLSDALKHNLIQQGTLSVIPPKEPNYLSTSPSNNWVCKTCHNNHQRQQFTVNRICQSISQIQNNTPEAQ